MPERSGGKGVPDIFQIKKNIHLPYLGVLPYLFGGKYRKLKKKNTYQWLGFAHKYQFIHINLPWNYVGQVSYSPLEYTMTSRSGRYAIIWTTQYLKINIFYNIVRCVISNSLY